MGLMAGKTGLVGCSSTKQAEAMYTLTSFWDNIFAHVLLRSKTLPIHCCGCQRRSKTSTIAWTEVDDPAAVLGDIEWGCKQPEAILFHKWVSVLASRPYVVLLESS